MGAPKAIQEQGDAADAAQKALAEGTLVEVEGAKKKEPPPDPNKAEVEVEDKEKKPPAKEVDEWQHKYDVLNGIFKAEISKRDTQIGSLTDTVKNLNDLLVQMRDDKGSTEQGAGPGKESPSPDKELNPSDFEGYGAEMSELVGAFNKLVKRNSELEAQLSSVGQEVGDVKESVAQTGKDTFYGDLAKEVSDWRQVNADMSWRRWLSQPDPLSGIRRQDLLDDAFRHLDVKRVAKIFKVFKQEGSVVAPPAGSDTVKAPAKTLDGQVLPDGGTGAEQPKPGDEIVVTPEQFAKASQDVIAKRITQEEYQKITVNFQRSLTKMDKK